MMNQDVREHLIKDEDESVRKSWFVSFILVWVLTILNIFSSLLARNGFSVTNGEVLIYLVMAVALTMPWYWITYHCSYYKRGTAWLVWMMITAPIQFLLNMYREGLDILVEWGSFGWSLISMDLGIEFYFLINCYFYYKANAARKKRVQEHAFNSSLERAQAIHAMENTLDVFQLDVLFYRSISLWPQWEKELVHIYNKQKEHRDHGEHRKEPCVSAIPNGAGLLVRSRNCAASNQTKDQRDQKQDQEDKE